MEAGKRWTFSLAGSLKLTAKAPKDGWLEYVRLSYWGQTAYVQGQKNLLVSRRVPCGWDFFRFGWQVDINEFSKRRIVFPLGVAECRRVHWQGEGGRCFVVRWWVDGCCENGVFLFITLWLKCMLRGKGVGCETCIFYHRVMFLSVFFCSFKLGTPRRPGELQWETYIGWRSHIRSWIHIYIYWLYFVFWGMMFLFWTTVNDQ